MKSRLKNLRINGADTKPRMNTIRQNQSSCRLTIAPPVIPEIQSLMDQSELFLQTPRAGRHECSLSQTAGETKTRL